jgi:hypothetical protein
MVVLAQVPSGCAAVDVSSGSLVRAEYAGQPPRPLRPLELVKAVLGEDLFGPDPTQPEAVVLAGPPEPVGQVRPRQLKKLLAPLLLPEGAEPFGFPGSAARYWMVPGDRPSLALLRPEAPPTLVLRRDGHPACRFGWRRAQLELPLLDLTAGQALTDSGLAGLSGKLLAQWLGFDPAYLVLALTPPRAGHCYKAVAGLLPRR